ncbi:hypothetical protein HK098_003797 [Nowakowskiella sp. JEL0407]|nr:hypothetical protein HK098_003797 [Nowakowskiella sp. JEL0407]
MINSTTPENELENALISPEQAAAQAQANYTNVVKSESPSYAAPRSVPLSNTNSQITNRTLTQNDTLYKSLDNRLSAETNGNTIQSRGITQSTTGERKKFKIDVKGWYNNMNPKRRLWIVIGVVVLLLLVAVLIILAATGVFRSSNKLTVSLFSANTKQLWLEGMQKEFNDQNFPVENTVMTAAINITHGGSNVSSINPLPDSWSPQNFLWIQQLSDQYKNNISYLFPNGSPDCKSVAVSPVGIAMWKPMAEAMGWPNANIGWKDIISIAGNNSGWSTYGKPWGALRFGHGQPEFSNSGRLTLIAAIYALTTPSGGISVNDANSTAAAAALQKLSAAVQHMGAIDTDLIALMAKRGLTYLHAASTYEANVIQFNLKNPTQERLVFIYPSDGTFWSENPLCVLTGDQNRASVVKKFRDYILTRNAQTKLVQLGLRPVTTFADISLTQTSGTLFSQANGVLAQKTLENVKQIPYPNAETMQAVINTWKNVKKPSVSLLVIDTSGSMSGRGTNGVSAIESVRNAATAFINAMLPQDYLVILQFSTSARILTPSGTGSTTNLTTFALTPAWRASAVSQVADFIPDGETLLRDSIGQATEVMNGFRADDKAANVRKNYGIIVMTDGRDTSSTKYKSADALANSLPDGTESDQVHIFTIGFGDEVDENELTRVANRTNGKFYKGNVLNVASLYQQLSLEY